MRAFVIDTFKTPGHLDDVPLPEVGPADIRVRVTAAGVNPVDWKIRGGAMPGLRLPRVLGQDIAGIVDAVGSDVTRFAVGDRVVACARNHGGFADETIVPQDEHAEPIAKIPDGVDDATASALPTPGLTALACLNAAKVGSGTAVLIVGAAGAVGAIATQLAALRGADAIAVVKPNAAGRVRGYGAREVVDSAEPAEIVRAVQARFPNGVPAILDLVSDGDTLKKFAVLLAPGGTLITTNHVADEAWFREQGVRALNLTMSETPESSPAGLDELTGLIREGKLRVEVSGERPLAQAREILDESEHAQLHGKFVLRPAGRG